MTYSKDFTARRVAIYIRVSTIWQVDKESLSVQRRELTAYAQMILGISDVVVFEDAGYSAKNTDRPDYQSMMSRLRMGEFSHLLVWKIDRISRNLLDFAEMYQELKELGVTFVSKNEQFDTSSAIGEAMLKIILVFAELERNMTSERVSAVMISRAENGQWNGGRVPYGYCYSKATKELSVDPCHAHVVQKIYAAYEQSQSLIKVCSMLNSEGIPASSGKPWTPTTVSKILKNPFYVGIYVYNVHSGGKGIKKKPETEWITFEDHHPAIVEKRLFDRVNFLLSRNRRGSVDKPKTYSKVNTHIFAGLVVCGSCGANFSATLDRRRADGWRPSIYGCSQRRSNKATCQNKWISDVTIGPFVFGFISNILRAQSRSVTDPDILGKKLLIGKAFDLVDHIDSESLEQLSSLLKSNNNGIEYKPAAVYSKSEKADNQYDALSSRKSKLENALKRLKAAYLYGDDSMPEAEFLADRNRLLKQLADIDSKLAEIQQEELDETLMSDEFQTKASYFLMLQSLIGDKPFDYEKYIKEADPEIPKAFINTVAYKIEATDGRITAITFRNGITYKFHYK